MTKTEKLQKRTIIGIFGMALTLALFAGAALAVDKRIDMEGSTATIAKGNTVVRNLYRIPPNTAGQIRLRLKWHAVNPVPYFNRLSVSLRHGSQVMRSRTCYSFHSNKPASSKCIIDFNVSQTEANRTGRWNIRVTNNSGLQVIGFDVEKGNDNLPMVPQFRSVFRYTEAAPACSESTKSLYFSGSTITIPKGNTVTKTIYRVGKSRGVIFLRAKWYAVNPVPFFNPLSVALIKPNGQVARSRTAYSYHNKAGKPKMVIRYDLSNADAQLSGNWKIRIRNNSGLEVIGFDIKKGNDPNPLVPNFRSTYRNLCS